MSPQRQQVGMLETSQEAPEIVIVDGQQLLYRIVWPHGGSPSDLIASMHARLARYADSTEKVIVFDKYEEVSAPKIMKEHGVLVKLPLATSSPSPASDYSWI